MADDLDTIITTLAEQLEETDASPTARPSPRLVHSTRLSV